VPSGIHETRVPGLSDRRRDEISGEDFGKLRDMPGLVSDDDMTGDTTKACQIGLANNMRVFDSALMQDNPLGV
jgi:hypothetical protein